jgi:uncharacterized protein YcbK (DUF882 family)
MALSAILVALAPASPALAARGGTTHQGREAVPGHGGAKSASKSKSKKARHREPVFSGWAVARTSLSAEPLDRPSGELVLESVNFPGESLHANLYKEDGTFDDQVLDELYHLWRCRRTGTEKPIDPHLFELLSHIYDHFHAPIQLVSGFRNQEHLTSYHFHGSASDIRIPGVSDKALRDFASTLDRGGMGLGWYPRAGFIHVDVRPESFRWIDRSPPSENMGHRRRHTS